MFDGTPARGFEGRPSVQFVSKPIVPPFHDGTKCLVRDIATHLEAVRPIVMGGKESGSEDDPEPEWEVSRVYPGAGKFAPTFQDNLRAAAWLLTRSRADLWHFVFAPNPRSSTVGRVLKRLRRKPVLQTVASPPRDLSRPDKLLFGDVVVAQSSWTARGLTDAYEALSVTPPRLEIIPPPVGDIPARSPEVTQEVRAALGIDPQAPLFVYPGDLEVSGGAETVARLIDPISQQTPGARFVFAYRQKTPRADGIARELEARLDPERVRFTKHLGDILALIQSATAVLFPVDDLWGKVDLPIVLLESMSLGVPVMALNEGPLVDLRGAILMGRDDATWAFEASRLAHDPARRAEVSKAERRAAREHFSAASVASKYERLYLELLEGR